MKETTKKKRVYLNETPLWNQIKESDADIKVLLSDRNPGKSYAVKSLCMEDAMADAPFIYLRRNDIEVKTGLASGYLSDYWSKNRKKFKGYDGITDVRGEIYLGHMEDGRRTMAPDKLIGYACYLFGEQHYKSQAKFAESGVKNVIFEEFTTSDLYLRDEPARLESFWSTVKRDNRVTVWCLGNGMSRVCPYFSEWGLRNVPRQTPGTIERYVHTVHTGEDSIEMNIDVCIIPDLEGMGFGWFSKKKVKNTIWVTDSFPHLSRPLETYTRMFTCYVVAGDMYRFRLLFLYDTETKASFWYVEPMTKPIKPNSRIISSSFDTIVSNPYATVGFKPLVQAERTAFELLRMGHWVCSDNLTGDDFRTTMVNFSRL